MTTNTYSIKLNAKAIYLAYMAEIEGEFVDPNEVYPQRINALSMLESQRHNSAA